jgi:hypothetical protein
MEAQKGDKPVDWNALWTDVQPFGENLNSFMGDEFVTMGGQRDAGGHGLL